MKKIAVLLAHGFGLGLSPFASGTVGTLLALPIIWAFCRLLEAPAVGEVWSFAGILDSPMRLVYQGTIHIT